MSTYHSFISQPFTTAKEAQSFAESIRPIVENSKYQNSILNFKIIDIGVFYVVIGIYKNLGGTPVELSRIDDIRDWATVSDENDFYSS